MRNNELEDKIKQLENKAAEDRKAALAKQRQHGKEKRAMVAAHRLELKNLKAQADSVTEQVNSTKAKDAVETLASKSNGSLSVHSLYSCKSSNLDYSQ